MGVPSWTNGPPGFSFSLTEHQSDCSTFLWRYNDQINDGSIEVVLGESDLNENITPIPYNRSVVVSDCTAVPVDPDVTCAITRTLFDDQNCTGQGSELGCFTIKGCHHIKSRNGTTTTTQPVMFDPTCTEGYFWSENDDCNLDKPPARRSLYTMLGAVFGVHLTECHAVPFGAAGPFQSVTVRGYSASSAPCEWANAATEETDNKRPEEPTVTEGNGDATDNSDRPDDIQKPGEGEEPTVAEGNDGDANQTANDEENKAEDQDDLDDLPVGAQPQDGQLGSSRDNRAGRFVGADVVFTLVLSLLWLGVGEL
eukprot:TRINITY_DN70736_c0_g1_i1.p1 TRINITY_DN70736_c0_g1~~TRINITY_DN70736_c0_g1_i1.p1  ORF type:complete len:337 (-),score=25.06 TRINITY_DN70736_c0_g1_i1:105-1037(-)